MAQARTPAAAAAEVRETRLLFAQPEARLAQLQALPRTLWMAAITNAQGELEARLQGLVQLQAYLAGADAPWLQTEGAAWPPPAMQAPLWRAMNALELQRFCVVQPTLTETVIKSLLFHLDFVTHYEDRGASPEHAIDMAISAFASEWTTRAGEMDELMQVFGMLPHDSQSSRWDALQGTLHSAGWQEVLRSHRLLESLPALRRILQDLGRGAQQRPDEHAAQSTVPVMEPSSALQMEALQVRVPDLPGQTQGVHRSGRVARMLPAESLVLHLPGRWIANHTSWW